MILLEQVSFDLVVACWLRAELSSPRFRPRVAAALKRLCIPPRVIERPILTSPRENLQRQTILTRYRADICDTLPSDTRWWRGAISAGEFRRLRVINYPTWTVLSQGTGRLAKAAHTIAGEPVAVTRHSRWAHEARAVITHVREMHDQRKVADIVKHHFIVMGRPGGKIWTILEGNKRGTALYLRCLLARIEPLPTSLQVFVGLTAKAFPWTRVR